MRLALPTFGVLCFAAALAAPTVEAQARRAQSALPAVPDWARCATGSGGSTVEPVRRLTALTDKRVVETAIGRVFAGREKEQRVSAPNLAGARVSIDFLYTAGPDASRVYYYEASKTIPDAEGLLRVSVAGWLRATSAGQHLTNRLGAGSLQPLGSKSELHWSELSDDPDAERPVIPEPPVIPDPVADLSPLGVLSRAGQQTWVMKRSLGRGTVLVYDLGDTGVRLRTPVPGC